MILSVFAGSGKTHFSQNPKYKDSGLVVDLESTPYRWKYSLLSSEVINFDKEKLKGLNDKRVLNEEWPVNYLRDIEIYSKFYKYVLIAQYPEVRDLLKKRGIDYYLVYPSKSCKDEYVRRYRERGNSDNFIETIRDNFEFWVDQLNESTESHKIIIKDGEYLEDALRRERLL